MNAANQKPTGQAAEELQCPLRYMLNMFGGKWKLPIVCMLAPGTPLRYSSIKRKLGNITNVMLAQSLKDLEASGIVNRKQYNEVPPRVEYCLTKKGKGILPALVKVAGWAVEDMQGEAACGSLCDKCQVTR
ncbi:MAG: helix-turn-helix transcriptional regulator [Gracilibacteraceae bacterium]|nr:helix-turn-helix transcriptional regulator [Gracilibacteraceae bacterium]